MSGIIQAKMVETGSDYDFWKINLPIQSKRYKQSSDTRVNILPQIRNSILSQGGSNSVLK